MHLLRLLTCCWITHVKGLSHCVSSTIEMEYRLHGPRKEDNLSRHSRNYRCISLDSLLRNKKAVIAGLGIQRVLANPLVSAMLRPFR